MTYSMVSMNYDIMYLVGLVQIYDSLLTVYFSAATGFSKQFSPRHTAHPFWQIKTQFNGKPKYFAVFLANV